MNRLNLRKRKRINYYEPDEPAFDEYIYCEHCYDFVYEYCSIHGPLLIIPDNKVTSLDGIPPWVPRAALTTPPEFVHIAPSGIPGAGLGVFSTLTLPRGVRFGPYQGKLTDEVSSLYCWQIHKKTKRIVVDGQDKETSNWMRYVNCARNWREQNLVAFQYQGQIYYRTVKIVPKFTELLVFYGSEFAHTLGIDLKNYNKTQELHIGKYTIEDVNTNQRETYNEDYLYKTETLAIYESTPRNNEQNTRNVETYEDILEQAANFTTPQIEFVIDTTRSRDTVTDDIVAMNCFVATTDIVKDETAKDDIVANDIVKNDNNQDQTIKTERLECDVCYTTYKTNDSLRRHKYVHKEAKDAPYTCMLCTYKTHKRYRFNIHMDRHRKDKEFPCGLCSYVGHVQNDLRRHTRRLHSDKILEPGTHSTITRIEFGIDTTQSNDSSKTMATNDIVTDDIVAMNYFKATPDIVKNETTKDDIVANDIGTNDNNQDQTIKTEILQCDICYKTYKTNDSLRKHKYIHKEANDARYNCMLCTFKTHKRYNFNIHMDRHRKEKEFPCELCSYVGHVQDDLRRHTRRLHTNKY